jgi:hypothetical protein
MHHCRVWKSLWVSGLLASAGATPAFAQVASGGGSVLFRSDAAGVRVEPQYEPEPLRLGSLIADVRVAVAAVADSNVLRTAEGNADNVYLNVAPSVRLIGNIGPDSIALVARADLRRFASRATENSETFDLAASGRLDLGLNAQATWRAQMARDVELRGSAGSNVVAAGPAEYRTANVQASGQAQFGRLAISTSAAVSRRSYLPLVLNAGGKADQSFRDTRTVTVGPRANFSLTPATAFFVGGSASETQSLDRRQGRRRDSRGLALLAGVKLEGERLVVGEIGVGWRAQNYRNPLFSDYSGLTYDATIDWYPTPLISFRAQAGQDIVNSGLATVAGIIRQNVGVKAFYDPRRNVRVTLAIDHEHDDFREIGLTTDTTSTILTGQYLAGRHLIMSAFCRLQVRDASDGQSLDDYRSLAIGFAFTGRL